MPWRQTYRVPGNPFVGHRQGHTVREIITLEISLSEGCRPYPGQSGLTNILVELSDIPPHLVRKDGTLGFGQRFHLTIMEILEVSFGDICTSDLWDIHDHTLPPHPDKPGVWQFDSWIDRWMDLTASPAPATVLPPCIHW